MTKSNKPRLTLANRFRLWMTEDENPLDAQIERGVTELSTRALHDLHPELYAQEESALEQKRLTALETEQRQYARLHEWSQHQGLTWLNRIYRTLAVLVCLAVVLFLLRTIVALPPFGAANNPYNNEVSRRYIESGIEETGAVNFVAGMILDYRAFDTFGESTVLFAAACSVILLLKLGELSPDHPSKAMLEAEYDDRHHEPKNDVILQLAARVLTPIILLFGMYVILNGHLSPGGGFSGGAIMGAGLILYLNAFGFQKTERFFTFKTFQWITFLSLMTYAGLKSYSFYMGANHMESGIPLGIPGAILSSGLILPLNFCVGLVVMCTMYAFYTLFRKGGM
ncbi:MAG: hydrogen gas-evolving membrane-bound hydrogenase subunit E [Clostridia bacterium]